MRESCFDSFCFVLLALKKWPEQLYLHPLCLWPFTTDCCGKNTFYEWSFLLFLNLSLQLASSPNSFRSVSLDSEIKTAAWGAVLQASQASANRASPWGSFHWGPLLPSFWEHLSHSGWKKSMMQSVTASNPNLKTSEGREDPSLFPIPGTVMKVKINWINLSQLPGADNWLTDPFPTAVSWDCVCTHK